MTPNGINGTASIGAGQFTLDSNHSAGSDGFYIGWTIVLDNGSYGFIASYDSGMNSITATWVPDMPGSGGPGYTLYPPVNLFAGSISAIADAVWNAATRTLTSFGSLVSSIWSNVTRTLTSASSLGPGANQCTITITRTDTTPIPDANVWITSDAPGATVVAGTLNTNSNGHVLFMLDAGATYYLWMEKDGENSIRGQQFTAAGD